MSYATIDPAELRRLAIEASGGDPAGHEWEDCSDGWTVRVRCDDENKRGAMVGTTFRTSSAVEQQVAIAQYVAALHPQAVLALLDRLAAAEADRDNLRRLLGLLYCAREDVDMETWREVKAALEGE